MREHKNHVMVISGPDYVLIPCGPAWLSHIADAGLGGPVDVVPEREEAVRGKADA